MEVVYICYHFRVDVSDSFQVAGEYANGIFLFAHQSTIPNFTKTVVGTRKNHIIISLGIAHSVHIVIVCLKLERKKKKEK
jgi:hypothetical protein